MMRFDRQRTCAVLSRNGWWAEVAVGSREGVATPAAEQPVIPVVAPGLVTMSSQVSARQALFADRFAGRVSWASVGNEWRLLVAAKKDADLLQIAEDEAL